MTTAETDLIAEAPQISLADRVVADLRVLAAAAETNPELARHLARSLDEITLVLARADGITPDAFGPDLVTRGATTGTGPQGWDQGIWTCRSWLLPAGVIRLDVEPEVYLINAAEFAYYTGRDLSADETESEVA